MIIKTDQQNNNPNVNDNKNNNDNENKDKYFEEEEIKDKDELILKSNDCENDQHEEDENYTNSYECEIENSFVDYKERIEDIFEYMNKQNKFELIGSDDENNNSFENEDRNIKNCNFFLNLIQIYNF